MSKHPRTLTEKLLLDRAFRRAAPGSAYYRVQADLVLGHEATIALLIEQLKRTGKHVRYPERCFFAADHFVPPSTIERAHILSTYVDFLRQEGISMDLLYRGISHQLLAEDSRCQPGMIICGADSHTVMVGALGCFATGIGSTDTLVLLLTGETYMSIPQSIRVTFTGEAPQRPVSKDLALEIVRLLGEGGAIGCALEYHDLTRSGISMDGRLTIANMAVEAGATNGVFVPDTVTKDYLAKRDLASLSKPHGVLSRQNAPDPDAHYLRKLDIDVGSVPPLVALPGSLEKIVPVSEAGSVPVQQVFVGSCAGGRLEDLECVARLMRGMRVAPGVQLVVTPASQKVYQDCIRNGVLAELAAAGALITNSSCGACGGIDKGLISANTNCVSTSNRNFRGRMGSPDGRIYLASPATAAAAAITGTLTDPRCLTSEPAT